MRAPIAVCSSIRSRSAAAERAGLAQQLAGDADLADVVQQGAVAEPVELGAADPQPLADRDREVGDLVGVVGGVGVLQLDRVGEDAERW